MEFRGISWGNFVQFRAISWNFVEFRGISWSLLFSFVAVTASGESRQQLFGELERSCPEIWQKMPQLGLVNEARGH